MNRQAWQDEAVLTNAECHEADRLAVHAGVCLLGLMERAGMAIADAIQARYAPCRIHILCGPGNNGGDGFVAARHLAARGYDISLFLLVKKNDLKGAAAIMAESCDAPLLPLSAQSMEDAELVVDSLFGAGLSRPLSGIAAALASASQHRAVPLVAVDVPSGLPGDGASLDGPVFSADLTVTFFRRKPAHLLLPGRDLCGEIVLADIGIPPRVLESLSIHLARNRPSLWSADLPPLLPAAHKYTRGHALVIGGGLAQSPGAGRLAAEAALYGGAGLVTLAVPSDVRSAHAAGMSAVMTRSLDEPEGLDALLNDRRLNAVLIGPGCGVHERTRRLVERALSRPVSVVLDADALSVFATAPDELFARLKDRPALLTPHEGEFLRLFPDLKPDKGSKVERARLAAKRSGSVILLKGADTVIAEPGGQATINDNAPSSLATAGSGDVLAGAVLALLAQGIAPFVAAAAGTWLHGQAARHLGPALTAADLPRAIARARTDFRSPAGLGGNGQHSLSAGVSPML
jgi:NAD(P)H-hydrate epimerase